MNWEPREADVERFTTGDCHIFAHELHKATGWPMECFVDLGEPEPDYQASIHAFCRRPDGKLVDIEGVHEHTTFIEKWDTWGASHEAGTMEVQWPIWDGYMTYGDYSRRRARVLIPRLLEAVK